MKWIIRLSSPAVGIEAEGISDEQRCLLRLTNPDLDIDVTSEASEEQYEILIHQIQKGDKGDKGDPGSTDYLLLEHKPQIEGVELVGNKTLQDLGIAGREEIPTKVSELENDSDFIGDAPNDNNIWARRQKEWEKTAFAADVEWGDF